MRLGDFREQTKDLPDTAQIWILDEGEIKAWKMPTTIEVIETQHRYIDGQDIPEAMRHQTEVRLRLPK
jgi:hypothetical protein